MISTLNIAFRSGFSIAPSRRAYNRQRH
jgi:hypothetical protein